MIKMVFFIMKKVYPLFLLIILIFGLYVLKLNFSSALNHLDWMKIKKVRFYGLKSIQANDLMLTTSLTRDTSLVFLDKKKLKKHLELDKRLTVKKIVTKFPDTLEIHLFEDIGSLLYRDKGNLFAISQGGHIISSNENIFYYDLPILINHNLIREDTKKSASELNSEHLFTNLIEAFDNLPENEKDFKDLISEIHLDKAVKFYLRNGIKMLVPDPITIKALRKARYSLLYALSLKEKVEVIDIREDLVKYRLH